MRVYYDRDSDLNLIKGKKVAVVCRSPLPLSLSRKFISNSALWLAD